MIASKLYIRTNLGCQCIFFIKPLIKQSQLLKKKKQTKVSSPHRHLKHPKSVNEILEVFCNVT